mmetsp:Transcript_24164/g.53766  ORF Transcript_24164/g.53766 Transcript_24164/m.53766 type:complete len:388 (-) Transcript_24164:1437-2600(-)
MSTFDGSISACAVDALSIICKRSNASSNVFSDISSEEVDRLYSMIITGDASRTDLEDVDDLNILWCAVTRILKTNSFFSGGDVSTEASELAVEVQRFLAALFSTFEVLLQHHPDSCDFLVGSVAICLKGESEAELVRLLRDYRSYFNFAYIFNRRTGRHPQSQVDAVSSSFAAKKVRELAMIPIEGLDGIDVQDTSFLEEGVEEDSYEELMQRSDVPHISAPSVMPLMPVRKLSDEYYSDYQPAASDVDDLDYGKDRGRDRDRGALPSGSLSGQAALCKASPLPRTSALLGPPPPASTTAPPRTSAWARAAPLSAQLAVPLTVPRRAKAPPAGWQLSSPPLARRSGAGRECGRTRCSAPAPHCRPEPPPQGPHPPLPDRHRRPAAYR